MNQNLEKQQFLEFIYRLSRKNMAMVTVGGLRFDVESGFVKYDPEHPTIELLENPKLHADGYHIAHNDEFENVIHSLTERVGIVVRHCLDERCIGTRSDGHQFNVPWKNIFGYLYADKRFIGLGADDILDACTLDSRTQERLDPERSVHYIDAPEFAV